MWKAQPASNFLLTPTGSLFYQFFSCSNSPTGFWLIRWISLWIEMRLLEVGTLAVLVFIHIYDYLLLCANSFCSLKCFIGVITRLIDQILSISPAIISKANVCSFINTNISDFYESSVIGVKCNLNAFVVFVTCFFFVFFFFFLAESKVRRKPHRLQSGNNDYRDAAVTKKDISLIPATHCVSINRFVAVKATWIFVNSFKVPIKKLRSKLFCQHL